MRDLSRALKYKFFSLMFLYPSRERFEKAEMVVKDLAELGYDSSEVEKKIREVKDFKKLQVEYTRLFINAFPHVPCAPYESFFKFKRLSDPSILMSLKSFYNKLGYDAESEATDHISTELEFMYLVLAYDSLSGEEKLRLQFDFFSKHLSTWVMDFVKCVKSNSKEEIYLILSKKLEEFMREEIEYFDI